MESKSAKVTKPDAASRQLNQGIRLFFERGDMLAVHTLTAAAFQLFEDLGRGAGIVSRFRSDEFLQAERIDELTRAFRRTQNFLKHADKDCDATLDYVEEGTVLFVYEAVELAGRIAVEDTPERFAFRAWFVFSFPELFDPAYIEEVRAGTPTDLTPTDRDLWALWLKRGQSGSRTV